MFGKRDPEAWKGLLEQTEVYDNEMEKEDNPEVRHALAGIRNDVIIAALPPIQHDLWHKLINAYRIGDLDLMQMTFKSSGCSLADLCDLLYVADQLSIVDGGQDYRNFCQQIFELLYRYRGARLDNYLANLFGTEFQAIDTYLLGLAENEQLVRGRLQDYEDIWKKNRKSPDQKKPLNAVDFQPVVAAGVERLIDLEAGFTSQEAEDLLLFTHEIDLGLDKINVPLVEASKDARFIFNLLEALVVDLNHGAALTYSSDFDTVIAKMTDKLHSRGLLFLINQRNSCLYNERLLALSKLDNSQHVSDEVIMELMLERDERQPNSIRETQRSLRKEILQKRSLGGRVVRLGIGGTFSAQEAAN